jgi:hypothetical protein
MQITLVKRQPKRRCRIPRRPHPDLDYFFGRLERADGDVGLEALEAHDAPSLVPFPGMNA